MSGEKGSVQAKIKQEQPRTTYVCCVHHRLVLADLDAIKKYNYLTDFELMINTYGLSIFKTAQRVSRYSWYFGWIGKNILQLILKHCVPTKRTFQILKTQLNESLGASEKDKITWIFIFLLDFIPLMIKLLLFFKKTSYCVVCCRGHGKQESDNEWIFQTQQ